MIRVVPERRDLYRMLALGIIALMAVFHFTPEISGAAPHAKVVAQTAAPVSGVSGSANPTLPATNYQNGTTAPSSSASTGTSGPGSVDTASGATSPVAPTQTGLQVPQGFAPVPYATPATNTPPPTTPGANP